VHLNEQVQEVKSEENNKICKKQLPPSAHKKRSLKKQSPAPSPTKSVGNSTIKRWNKKESETRLCAMLRRFTGDEKKNTNDNSLAMS